MPDVAQIERYLVVRVAGQLCALPLAPVIEVLRAPPMAASDSSARGLQGFATLRGEPSAVYALAVLLGLGYQPAEDQFAVRIRIADGSAALLVDEVLGVQTLSAAELTRVHLPGGEERTLGRFDRDFAAMLDLGGLLPAPHAESPAPHAESPAPQPESPAARPVSSAE